MNQQPLADRRRLTGEQVGALRQRAAATAPDYSGKQWDPAVIAADPNRAIPEPAEPEPADTAPRKPLTYRGPVTRPDGRTYILRNGEEVPQNQRRKPTTTRRFNR